MLKKGDLVKQKIDFFNLFLKGIYLALHFYFQHFFPPFKTCKQLNVLGLEHNLYFRHD